MDARSEVDAIDHRRLRDVAQDNVLALSHRKSETSCQSSFQRAVWRRASETDRMSLFDFQPSQLCPPKVLCGSSREAHCALPADPEPFAILGLDLGHESTDLQFAGDLEVCSRRPCRVCERGEGVSLERGTSVVSSEQRTVQELTLRGSPSSCSSSLSRNSPTLTAQRSLFLA